MGACIKPFLWSTVNWLNIWKCERLCAHGDTCAHTCMNTHVTTSSRLISLPIGIPPICHQPAKLITSDKRVQLGGSLSISISPPQPLSFFYTIRHLSLCFTTLRQLSPANKLHQSPNYLNIQLPCACCLLVLCVQTIFMCCWKTLALQHVLISQWPLSSVCIWHFCNS